MYTKNYWKFLNNEKLKNIKELEYFWNWFFKSKDWELFINKDINNASDLIYPCKTSLDMWENYIKILDNYSKYKCYYLSKNDISTVWQFIINNSNNIWFIKVIRTKINVLWSLLYKNIITYWKDKKKYYGIDIFWQKKIYFVREKDN